MNKRIIISVLAIMLALSTVVAFTACKDNENKGNGGNEVTLSGDETDDGTQNGNGGGTTTEPKNPGEYQYIDCDETVYVNNPGSAVTLRTTEYEAKGSIKHGTELKRIGLSFSTDVNNNYWSKVIYEGETYYVASKFLADINVNNLDDGFVACEKTVYLNGTTTQKLNVRNLPSMSGSVIGHVSYEQSIKVIMENTTTEWYKIEFVNNSGETVTGYIASDAKHYETNGNDATTEAENNQNNATEPESAGK